MGKKNKTNSIDRFQAEITAVHYEIGSISALLRSLSHDIILTGEELYGVGIILDRICEKLTKLSTTLDRD